MEMTKVNVNFGGIGRICKSGIRVGVVGIGDRRGKVEEEAQIEEEEAKAAAAVEAAEVAAAAAAQKAGEVAWNEGVGRIRRSPEVCNYELALSVCGDRNHCLQSCRPGIFFRSQGVMA